jgi:dihydroorotase
MQLFTNWYPGGKRITAEVCVHHLHFTSDDYAKLGNRIKCNPAIKAPNNREALWQALLDDRLDVIATDHAPHLPEEKGLYRSENGLLMSLDGEKGSYEKAHAGLPLVQHPLLLMLYYMKAGRISIEKLVEKMSHAVATCFRIAGQVLSVKVILPILLLLIESNHYRCEGKYFIQMRLESFEALQSDEKGFSFRLRITHTFVNGHLVYGNGVFDESKQGQDYFLMSRIS